MNRVFLRSEEDPPPPWTGVAGKFVKSVLRKLKLKNWELSVLFCGNKYIKTLNAQYRNKDEATDVLSFPLGETGPSGQYLAGDIVVSLDALEENSRYFNVTKDEELRRLLVHGILHLAGGDHATNKGEEPMLREQEALLAALTEKVI
jgi:probable rRNA maturation factor